MTAQVHERRRGQPGREGHFARVEKIRAEVRGAGLEPATDAELRELDQSIAGALANNAIEGIQPDAELSALLDMLREERVSPRDFDRFYDRYLSEWARAVARK